ncbi:MAG: hypothetical protein RLZZ373_3371 [Pseudomonadota bacterium]
MTEDAPISSATWLERLHDAERADTRYHAVCDKIDKLYSDLDKLAGEHADREFQIFWANLEVLRPTIYSRPPVPVVGSRFNDRRPLPRRAAEILERALISDFEADDVHDTLVMVRDDLALSARGVPWLMFKERDGYEWPSVVHVDRKDFRHEPARKWPEVGWVSRRSWNTKDEVAERFGEVPPGMKFQEQKIGDFKGAKKAQIWECWDEEAKLVSWVTEDVPHLLDQKKPWFDVKGFFPCPRPAYGTLKRGTLTPVPDMVYYKDQMEEINEITARISALSEGLRIRGIYAAGLGEVGDAVERALKSMDNNVWLEPIPSLGNMAIKDVVMFLPIEEIANAVSGLVELRRQFIDDVYQITGLSDIMRGETDANETLGAQQLKSQYGSVRVKERQAEMVRVARDVTRMKAEMLAEGVEIDQLLTMAQVDDLPRQADIDQQMQQMQGQVEQQIMQIVQQAMQAPPPMPPGAQGMPMDASAS